MADGSSFPKGKPLPDPPKPKLQWGLRWAEEGLKVWLPWEREKNSAIRCTVLCAAGHHVRIVNERFKVDKWMYLDNLLIEVGDPHGYGFSG